MPRKVIKQLPTDKDDIKTAEPGDFCYYLNSSNKPVFAEIQKVITEKDLFVLQVICQQEYKFRSLPFYYCAFSEKDLKGKKRAILRKEHENV